ncbi:MAG: DNA mismatch repair protein MutS [Erysipelotrichaceae bacterium]
MTTYTPMMRQYLEVKENHKDAIVFYRLGDFYEMFFEDAKIACKELDLVLTGRNAGTSEKVPMCGIPYHAVNNYLPKLVSRGYKVAIVEQLEEPSAGKIVKRDVVKIVTPGTIVKENLEDKENICIASISDFQYGYAVVIVDISTGETMATLWDHQSSSIRALLLKNNVKEVVTVSSFNPNTIAYIANQGITISYCDEVEIDENYQSLTAKIQDARILEAYGIMVNYIKETQKKLVDHLQVIQVEDEKDFMRIDFNTILNLELIQPIQTQSKSMTLWHFLDRCQSSMGSRALKKMIERPLMNQALILQRQKQVEILKNHLFLQDDLKEQLSQIYDLKRLTGKIALGTSNPLDCIRLSKTLKVVPVIQALLKDYPEFTRWLDIDACVSLQNHIENAIVETPPNHFKEGGIFKSGYDEELDELLTLSHSGKQWIISQENYERERTGIKNLKIGYNRVFGYYIEVSKGNIPLIKEEYGYIRKQTLTNQERYVTTQLKEEEDKILHAQEKAIRKEVILYNELIETIKQSLFKLQRIADSLAYLDCIYALSVVANEHGYTKPIFNPNSLVIENGRHPILEHIMKHEFVSNDCKIEKDHEVLLITGPNMGGKSTYMRMVALISVLAQIGSFVPASRCEIPLFDAIYTRIGASDDILSGQSTFMVEMNEANHALMNATMNSLIIFDEIGRGTSTYDGMSLARAMIEYIATNIKAKTLFSTHYHELTSLDQELDNVVNYHVLVHEENDHVTFMYKMAQGKASKSYGINVARLAKLPESILNRATTLLNELENKEEAPTTGYQMIGLPLENIQESKLTEMLELVDPNELTPLQALQFVMDLKDKIKS